MHEIDKTKLSDQTIFRLYEIKKIENYFINEINERESYIKKLNKYVIIFDYIDRQNINCSKWNNWRNVTWCTSWNSKCKFYFNFFYNNRNHQKIIKYNNKEKEKA